MKYLIFNNEEEALARSDEAGAVKGLAYHKGYADGTRYVWGAILEEGGEERAALDVEKNTDLLTAEERANRVDELPEDWVEVEDDVWKIFGGYGQKLWARSREQTKKPILSL